MTTTNLILLATLLLVVILGGFNWFAIWTGVPLLMAAVLVEFSLASSGGDWDRLPLPTRLGLVGMIAGVVVLTLYEHVTLFFGIGLDPDDKTSGPLGYMVAPLYAMLGGAAGYVGGYLYGRKRSPDSRGSEPPRSSPRDRPPSGAE